MLGDKLTEQELREVTSTGWVTPQEPVSAVNAGYLTTGKAYRLLHFSECQDELVRTYSYLDSQCGAVKNNIGTETLIRFGGCAHLMGGRWVATAPPAD
jgi:hypothetical protein